MNVAMIGAGYVGITTGVCFAELGHHVTCVDLDEKRIALLNAGELPIHEPSLGALMRRNAKRRRLGFTSDLPAAVQDADAVFIAVGTPSRPDGSIDLTYVEAAARQIATRLRRDAVVVVKSTVVPGTARRLREIIAETRRDLDVCVASNPEFLREGSAVADFMFPDRIVVGSDEPHAIEMLEELYAKLIAKGAAWLATTTTNAEMIKYAANSLLALKIGFINEIADLCEAVGGDVTSVSAGVGLDSRIGTAFLEAGPGYGGSCFPKDTRALAAIGRMRGAPQRLIETLIEDNERRKSAVADRILAALDLRRAPRVAVLGVAFKRNTDDIRDSAVLTIIPALQRAGCEITVHDPKAKIGSVLPGISQPSSPYEAAADADLVVILTEWQHYRRLNLKRLRRAMRGDIVFDCRGVVDAQSAAAAGLRYLALGRAVSGVSSIRRMKPGGALPADRIAALPA